MLVNLLEDTSLTGKPSRVLKHFFVGKYANESHLGIDVEGTTIFSLCFGVVCSVGADESGFQCVTVQYDEYQCVRYCHLDCVDSNIVVGSTIEYKDAIGTCTMYVHLEYGVSTTISSNSIIRCNELEYYKSDPLPLLENRRDMIYDYREDEDYKDLSGMEDTELDEITQDILNEFDGGAGNE